jgi:hypothetical protein
VNRVYGVVAKAPGNPKVSVPMNMMAAIVLPLQGFFNCVIYLFFSRAELRREMKRFSDRFRGHRVPQLSPPSPRALESGYVVSTQDTNMSGSREGITAQEMMDLDPTLDYDDDQMEAIDLKEMLRDSMTWRKTLS